MPEDLFFTIIFRQKYVKNTLWYWIIQLWSCNNRNKTNSVQAKKDYFENDISKMMS